MPPNDHHATPGITITSRAMIIFLSALIAGVVIWLSWTGNATALLIVEGGSTGLVTLLALDRLFPQPCH